MDVRSDAEAQLDRAFMALADPVRRAIVARLSRSSATITELAGPFAMTTQAVSKHVHVLEHAGLVRRSRNAQMRPAHLVPEALEGLTSWIDTYRLVAESGYRRLDALFSVMTPSIGPARTIRAGDTEKNHIQMYNTQKYNAKKNNTEKNTEKKKEEE